uniref:Uncharacterized protein n=1 Tax=Arundo donax TaxID=35708 RepID=A0A0A9C879_ARUDO
MASLCVITYLSWYILFGPWYFPTSCLCCAIASLLCTLFVGASHRRVR